MKFWISIKFKVFLVCMSLTLIMTTLLCFLLLEDIRGNYTEQQSRLISSKLQITTATVDQDYMQILRFSTWLSSSSKITQFLTAGVSSENLTSLKVAAYNEASSLMLNMGTYNIVDKCIIVSDTNGQQVRLGWISGDSTDYTRFLSIASPDETPFLSGMVKSPFFYATGGNVIPFSTRIYSSGGANKIGMAHIAVSENIITKHLKQFEAFENEIICVSVGNHIYRYEDNSFTELPIGTKQLQQARRGNIDSSAYYVSGLETMENQQFVAVTSSSTGITIMQNIPPFSFSQTSASAYRSILLYVGVILLITLIIVLAVIQMINRPVKQICNRISIIAGGDFSRDASIETEDEFGFIGRGINSMSKNIKDLLDTSLANEKEKKDYQFRMFQNQINPHFLYNTLNSIKWMGEIVHAPGIVEMSSALARMLRKIVKIDTIIISVEEELEFIADYIIIQSYRYGNVFKIHYNIADERLKRAKIIKFTLQPLVENAIFHGVEPKNTLCNIDVNVYQKENDLIVEIRDDGVGMEEDVLKRLNEYRSGPSKNSAGSIGINNIHERLLLEYGPSYGLTVTSVLHEYTCVTIRIPLEFMPE